MGGGEEHSQQRKQHEQVSGGVKECLWGWDQLVMR